MKVKSKVNIHNRFDIEVRDAITGELKQEAVAYNIVLDQMYTRLCGGSSYFVNIHFGTGTGTPTPDRTSLFAHLGTRAAVDEELIKAFPLSLWKRKIVLNPEEYVGSVITEVGVSFGTANANLVTHALLKDAEGNVISITKTDTDVVNIYATVYISFSENDPSIFLLNVSNADNALINWLVGGGAAPTGVFNVLPGEGYGIPIASSATVVWTSDTANKQRKTNVQRFPITVNGHIAGFDFTKVFGVKFPSPTIHAGQPYTGVAIGTGDGVKKEFIIASRNLIQDSIVMLVDGAVTTEYTKKIFKQLNFKRPNPDVLPPSTATGVALTPDGNIMAAAHSTSPYITTYDWNGSLWVKRPNPDVLPTNVGNGVALTPDGNIVAVAHSISPFITTYDGKARTTKIIFDTPPVAGKAITANYTTAGVHKTDQYVIDISFAIQFGEGV